MPSEPQPVLAEMILSGPEIVLVAQVLVTALEHAGLSVDDDPAAADLGPLVGVHARWTQHVYDLDSGGYGLSVDGIGLRVVTVPLSDVPVLTLVLKGHLVDLSVESTVQEGDRDADDLHVQAVLDMVARLEGLL